MFLLQQRCSSKLSRHAACAFRLALGVTLFGAQQHPVWQRVVCPKRSVSPISPCRLAHSADLWRGAPRVRHPGRDRHLPPRRPRGVFLDVQSPKVPFSGSQHVLLQLLCCRPAPVCLAMSTDCFQLLLQTDCFQLLLRTSTQLPKLSGNDCAGRLCNAMHPLSTHDCDRADCVS